MAFQRGGTVTARGSSGAVPLLRGVPAGRYRYCAGRSRWMSGRRCGDIPLGTKKGYSLPCFWGAAWQGACGHTPSDPHTHIVAISLYAWGGTLRHEGEAADSGCGLSEINIFSVGDSQDKHMELPVCNFVDYAVVTDANTVLVVLTF